MMRSCCLALAALFAGPAAAEVQCGYLFGTWQTAQRLAREGWAYPAVVQISMDRKEYQGLSKGDVEQVLRIVQDGYANPSAESSALIRECFQRQEAAKQGKGAPSAQ